MTVSQLIKLLEIYLDTMGDDVVYLGMVVGEAEVIAFPLRDVSAVELDNGPVCMVELDQEDEEE